MSIIFLLASFTSLKILSEGENVKCAFNSPLDVTGWFIIRRGRWVEWGKYEEKWIKYGNYMVIKQDQKSTRCDVSKFDTALPDFDVDIKYILHHVLQ